MKANEFVKKFGWEYAKHILTDDAPLVMDLNYTNLKRLVESHELVESYGGLSQSRRWIERTVFKLSDSMIALKKAIADVESCLEVSSESN